MFLNGPEYTHGPSANPWGWGPPYVVTFASGPVTGPGAIAGLRRMAYRDAVALVNYASPERCGRIVRADTLEVIEP